MRRARRRAPTRASRGSRSTPAPRRRPRAARRGARRARRRPAGRLAGAQRVEAARARASARRPRAREPALLERDRGVVRDRAEQREVVLAERALLARVAAEQPDRPPSKTSGAANSERGSLRGRAAHERVARRATADARRAAAEQARPQAVGRRRRRPATAPPAPRPRSRRTSRPRSLVVAQDDDEGCVEQLERGQGEALERLRRVRRDRHLPREVGEAAEHLDAAQRLLVQLRVLDRARDEARDRLARAQTSSSENSCGATVCSVSTPTSCVVATDDGHGEDGLEARVVELGDVLVARIGERRRP